VAQFQAHGINTQHDRRLARNFLVHLATLCAKVKHAKQATNAQIPSSNCNPYTLPTNAAENEKKI
jgi:hypothetical protein